ncbi:recoverin [Myotis myotis]|uniref:Recoverin n=1 Tax=Myotis myotis TaxID=51298 RepID=A0A7J7T8N4_MYOMY|nr:recoverin [Myotis myotis]XP_059527728.1 recoverin [Myotis daubentonii]KAF6296757.1 recoverin [Myotis myotis]
MGNSRSGALSREILEELQLSTQFTQEELCAWYQSFLRECPGGRITRQQFQGIYAKFFPDADPKAYAEHVFRSFDANSDGTLDFKEYVVALHMTTAGRPSQKLEWAFSLYDVDGNGAISKSEVLEIVMAIFKMINPEDAKHLPDDENTPEKRADKIWGFFGKKDDDKLTEEEFIEGTLANKEILRLIQFEPQKVKERLKEKEKNP